MQQIIKSNQIADHLTAVLNGINYDKLFVLTDKHTQNLCYPLISSIPAIQQAKRVTIAANDSNKTSAAFLNSLTSRLLVSIMTPVGLRFL